MTQLHDLRVLRPFHVALMRYDLETRTNPTILPAERDHRLSLVLRLFHWRSRVVAANQRRGAV